MVHSGERYKGNEINPARIAELTGKVVMPMTKQQLYEGFFVRREEDPYDNTMVDIWGAMQEERFIHLQHTYCKQLENPRPIYRGGERKRPATVGGDRTDKEEEEKKPKAKR